MVSSYEGISGSEGFGYTKVDIGIEKTDHTEKELFTVLEGSDFPLARFVSALSNEEKEIIDGEILNPNGLNPNHFDDDSLNTELVQRMIEEFLALPSSEERKQLANGIARQLDI